MRGWLDACTELAGRIFRYRIVDEGGSAQIRRRVLVAALEAEARMRQNVDTRRAALDPRNYTFLDDCEQPDGLTRVEGVLAKRPSFWTRRVEVVRRYERIAGVRVPVSMESTADVRILGRSSFTMTYDYRAINGMRLSAAPRAKSDPDCP